MGGLVGEFKTFVLWGNVRDLAIAVIIGAAFIAIATSFVENIVTPLIAAIGGQPDFSSSAFTINNSEIRYGAFITPDITVLVIALVIKPVNSLKARTDRPNSAEEPAVSPQCLSVISPHANRYLNYTSWLRGPNVAVS